MQTRLAMWLSGALLMAVFLGGCASEDGIDGPHGKTCARLLSDGAPPPGCGKLANSKGCCFLDGKRGYCDNNQIKMQDCGSQKCGWNGGQYACGPNAGSDPGGTWARSCFTYLPPPPDIGSGGDGNPPPPDLPPPLGDGVMNNCQKLTATGCCFKDGKHGTCDKGMIKISDCGSQKCGWNGGKYACGPSSSPDPSGKLAMPCSAYLPPPPDAMVTPKEQGVTPDKGPPPPPDQGPPPPPDQGPPPPDQGPPPPPDQGPPPPDQGPPPPDQGPPPPPDKGPPPPDKGPPPPDQKVPTPDQKVPTPDQKVPAPDQKVPTPDQKVPPPDQKVPTPDQKVPAPDQKVPAPDQKLQDAKEADAKETDKGVQADSGGKTDEDDTGCNCSTSATAPGSGLLGLLGLLVLAFRRRRSPS